MPGMALSLARMSPSVALGDACAEAALLMSPMRSNTDSSNPETFRIPTPYMSNQPVPGVTLEVEVGVVYISAKFVMYLC
jgi:hypothetical protein